ncbi:MAG TPA: hypothetical protein PK771_15550 [Spirochaetota bacterium]|nr:hypothetical protein [Spirochaetota bacterium]
MSKITFDEKGVMVLDGKALPCIIQGIDTKDALKLKTTQSQDEDESNSNVISGYCDRTISITCVITPGLFIKNENESLDEDIINYAKAKRGVNSALYKLLKANIEAKNQSRIIKDISISDIVETISKLHKLFRKEYFFEIDNEYINSLDIEKVIFKDISSKIEAGVVEAEVTFNFQEYDSVKTKTSEQIKKNSLDTGKNKESEKKKLQDEMIEDKRNLENLEAMR